MIAIDTSSWIAYLSGEKGGDVEGTSLALQYKQAALPPVVLSELLSDPRLPIQAIQFFKQLPLLDVLDGYWERAGTLRAKLISRGLKARLADSLIVQSCLDHDVPLITRDADFRHFVRSAGLKLSPLTTIQR